MQRGKIVLTRFPFSDLSSQKRRPVLVLIDTSEDEPDTIVAFISSVIPADLSQSELLFSSEHTDFSRSGLTKNSVFKFDKLASLQKSIFSGELGEVTPEFMETAKQKLMLALQLDSAS